MIYKINADPPIFKNMTLKITITLSIDKAEIWKS